MPTNSGWGRTNQFDILEVSEDGKKIEDELNDLDRDSASFERSEKVSHGAESQMAPDLELSSLSDEEVDSKSAGIFEERSKWE